MKRMDEVEILVLSSSFEVGGPQMFFRRSTIAWPQGIAFSQILSYFEVQPTAKDVIDLMCKWVRMIAVMGEGCDQRSMRIYHDLS